MLGFAAGAGLLLGLRGACPAMDRGADAGLGPSSVDDAACSGVWRVGWAALAAGYVKVLECEWQSAGDHGKKLFQLFLLLFLCQNNPTSAEMKR